LAPDPVQARDADRRRAWPASGPLYARDVDPSAPTDLLERPVYGTAQVDRILALRPGTAARWIDGYTRAGRTYPPVVREASTGSDTVTWGEFSETRLLSEYRVQGAKMIRMRPAVERLRQELGVRYPLAHAATWIEPVGRELVRRIQVEVDLDSELLMVVIRNDQLVLSLPTEHYFKSIDFGGTDVAQRIRPALELPDVWFDPLRQFGEPVVRSVPTAIIAEQYRAGDTIGLIADAYSLSEEEVEQAIRYELRGPRAPLAA
jgi:uncharacterized protein (DUF433 family)